MAATKYTYTKVTSPDTLEYQIRASSITVALDHIVSRSTDVDVWFKATLGSSDESILTAIINTHVAIPLLSQGDPKDPDNAPIVRMKAAKSGWAYQFHSLTFYTAAFDADGYPKLFNHKLNPVTRLLTPMNFATVNFYDANNTQITDPNHRGEVIWTVLDWAPNHEMEIIGGKLYQKAPPEDDVYLWLHLAPGILNFPFMDGGLNLETFSTMVSADGRVSKYLSPTLPIPGCNKFRITVKHPPGYQHELSFAFEFFKPVS